MSEKDELHRQKLTEWLASHSIEEVVDMVLDLEHQLEEQENYIFELEGAEVVDERL